MKRVLFICTGNAGRSQIAQVLFRERIGDRVDVWSAGVEPWDDLHPMARRLLERAGHATGGLYPKPVSAHDGTRLDVVVTIGDRAGSETPRLEGTPCRVHWPIDDPADADGTGREEEVFRRTWTAIGERLPELEAIVDAYPDGGEAHLAPGISTCVFRPDSFDPARHLPMIAEAGFAVIELCCFFGSRDFAWDVPGKARELRQVADDNGVRIGSVHSAGGLGCMRLGYSRGLSVDMLKAHADLAAELGASLVPMHSGLEPDRERPVAIRRLREDLAAIEAHAAGMPCCFGWENEPRGLTTAEHLEWLGELDPASFCFVLDPGHANQAGTFDAYMEGTRDLLGGLHLNDNDGVSDLHWLPGAGTIGWGDFVKRLKGLRYHGPLMLEILAEDRQDDLPTVLREARDTIDRLFLRT